MNKIYLEKGVYIKFYLENKNNLNEKQIIKYKEYIASKTIELLNHSKPIFVDKVEILPLITEAYLLYFYKGKIEYREQNFRKK